MRGPVVAALAVAAVACVGCSSGGSQDSLNITGPTTSPLTSTTPAAGPASSVDGSATSGNSPESEGSTPAAPAGPTRVTVDTSVRDVDDYRYRLQLTAHLDMVTTDITNSAPGMTALVVPGNASGTVTNATPGRNAPATFASYVPSAGTLDGLWPVSSDVCQELVHASTYAATIDGRRSRYCDIALFSFTAVGGLGPDESAPLVGGIFVNFSPSHPYELKEATAPRVARGLNAGPALWFLELGTGDASTPESVRCAGGFGNAVTILWASTTVRACEDVS